MSNNRTLNPQGPTDWQLALNDSKTPIGLAFRNLLDNRDANELDIIRLQEQMALFVLKEEERRLLQTMSELHYADLRVKELWLRELIKREMAPVLAQPNLRLPESMAAMQTEIFALQKELA